MTITTLRHFYDAHCGWLDPGKERTEKVRECINDPECVKGYIDDLKHDLVGVEDYLYEYPQDGIMKEYANELNNAIRELTKLTHDYENTSKVSGPIRVSS